MSAAATPLFLVTGASGQVGHELVRELSVLGRVAAPSSRELDLASPDSIREVMRRLRPSVVINAAAYTAVDRAESERERCLQINALGPGVLAEEAAALGAAIVHYSTDYVFDGSGSRPYTEDDPTGPIGVYGSTKLAGEQAVAAAGGGYLVLRTSWVYGARGANFVRTMLRLARDRPELRVVGDQVGAPTWSRTIAAATAHILRTLLTERETPAAAVGRAAGVYHLAAGGQTTWHEFATAVLTGDPRRAEQQCQRVIAIASTEYPTPARRPAFSLLDTTRIRERFGIVLADWREQLPLVLGDLIP